MKPIYTSKMIEISNNDDIGNKIMIITNKMGDENLSWDDALKKISKEMNLNDNIINDIVKNYRMDCIRPFSKQNYYHYPYVRDFDPNENIFPIDKICALINDLIRDNEFDNWEDAANYICKDLNISLDDINNAINQLTKDLNNNKINVEIYVKKKPTIKINPIIESFDIFNEKYKKSYSDFDIINKAKKWREYKIKNFIF